MNEDGSVDVRAVVEISKEKIYFKGIISYIYLSSTQVKNLKMRFNKAKYYMDN